MEGVKTCWLGLLEEEAAAEMLDFELKTVNGEEQACTLKHDGLAALISHVAYPDAGM